jgi:hypothetical protein
MARMKAGLLGQDTKQKAVRLLWIGLLVGVVIYFLLTRSNDGISVAVKDDHLSLSFSSGAPFDIPYRDILSVTEAQTLDPGQYISGARTKDYRCGVWKNDEFGEYRLCSYADVKRHIVVKTTAGTYVFNLESVDATDSFYNAFLDLLQTRQGQAEP